MEVKLRILVGNGAGQRVSVRDPIYLIGRADECNLRPKSAHISRRHCELNQADTRLTVRDLNSRTGTWVNGVRLPADRAMELQTGDRLKIGPLEFEVVLTHSLGGKKRPKVDSLEEAATRTAQGQATDSQIDITQWLVPDDIDLSLGDTEGGANTRTIVSAADFMTPPSPAGGAKGSADEAATEGKIDPRIAASEALKRHLRRG